MDIAGVFRQNQQASGVYSVFRNLLLGIDEVSRHSTDWSELGITIYWMRITSARGISFRDPPRARRTEPICFRDAFSRGLDVMLYPYYHVPPVCRASRNAVIVHDLQFHRSQYISQMQTLVA